MFLIIYINDFINSSSIFDFHLFEDDSNLFYSDKDLQHLYINDFINSSSIFDFHLFEDDSNLFYSDKDLQHLEETVSRELGEINAWLCANKLSLNIDETHFAIFHPYQKKLNYSMKIEIEGKTINVPGNSHRLSS